MPARLFIDRLALFVRIGTGPTERSRPQKVLLSGEIQLGEMSWGNDSILKTVDYDRLIREIVACGEATEFCLLERLVEEVVDHLMALFPGVSEVTLSVWKDPVPLPLELERVGVTVKETRDRWSRRKEPGHFSG